MEHKIPLKGHLGIPVAPEARHPLVQSSSQGATEEETARLAVARIMPAVGGSGLPGGRGTC